MRRSALVLGLLLALLSALPLAALATPAPTAPPTPPPSVSGGDNQPQATPKPERTPRPTEPPPLAFVVPAPDRPGLHVGYAGDGIRPQAPLLVAEEAGYFADAGFTHVVVARTSDVLADALRGDLDIGVVPAQEAYAALADEPTLQAIAGYRNYDAGSDEYRGEVLVAAPGLVSDEPATVLAFLTAYLRALELLSTDAGAQEAYEMIAATDLAVDVRPDGWARSLQAFAPFDGGFGDLEEGDGLGELASHLKLDASEASTLDGFIADHPLAITQTWAGATANPANPMAGPPGISEIAIAMEGPDSSISPITAGLEGGHYSDAGFSRVNVVDVDQPLLGLLQGQVEFGVMDLVDVTKATAQGLPLTIIAGHRNYREGGSYGEDVVVAASDLIEQEGSTTSAFLVAYLAALQDLADQPDTVAFVPFDGGFGDRERLGGLGELTTYLAQTADDAADLERVADTRALEYAQAWWGLPANPVIPAVVTEEGE